jgi:hypothetical protein
MIRGADRCRFGVTGDRCSALSRLTAIARACARTGGARTKPLNLQWRADLSPVTYDGSVSVDRQVDVGGHGAGRCLIGQDVPASTSSH